MYACSMNDIRALLHTHAYNTERRSTAVATQQQYHAYCDNLQAVETTSDELEGLGRGLRLLVSLLEEGKRANVDPFLAQALRGLLMPISTDLERHVATLREAVNGKFQ